MRQKLIIALAILTLFAAPIAPKAQNDIKKPKLVVNLSIAGMRYDYLLKFRNLMGEGGFKRLINEGALCERTIIDYIGTSTPSGLASIATGASPSSNGVIGSHWFDYTTGEKISLTYDKNVRTIGADELDAQVSPRAMVASTIGDCIKDVSPNSKVISIATEPNSAVIAGGFSTDGAYWISPRDGKMVSSSYYVDRLPDWVVEFNTKGLADVFSFKKWRTSRPSSQYYNVLRSDIEIGDDNVSSDILSRKKYDYQRLISSPGGNALIKDFVVQTVVAENLGADDATDYLTVVFDTPSIVSKKYGTKSMEIEDLYYRLDDELTSLLSFLDNWVGRENLLIVVTSPHGASDPVIESSKLPGGQFSAIQFSMLMNGFLGAQLTDKIDKDKFDKVSGDPRWILDFSNNQVYLNRRRIFDAGLSISEVQRMVAEFAIQFRGVAEAITASTMQSSQFTEGTMGMAQRSYFARHSGDVVLNLLPGWIVESSDISDSGSPYIYDTHVPLIFWGGAISEQNVLRDVKIEDIAPTIAHIVGVAPPNAASGTPITEVYRKN